MAQLGCDGLTVVYSCLAVLGVRLLVKWYFDPLRRLPTAGGSSLPLLSHLAAFTFLSRPRDVLQEGYEMYGGSPFKVSLYDRWLFVVCRPKAVEDLRSRPDSDLSAMYGLSELMQTETLLGKELNEDWWHIDMIKSTLTENLPSILPQLLDELQLAVQDHIPCEEGWTAVNVLPAAANIIARVSSRVFVGLPLCRAQPYIQLVTNFATARFQDAMAVKLIPPVLRPILSRFINYTRSAMLDGRAYIEPVIRARRAEMGRFGSDWHHKSNDLLQWYMDQAAERNMPDEALTPRIFLTNFGAIHTSAQSITDAICTLAASPEYIAPLRAEVDQVSNSDGWTKTALDKMWKVESFLRESQRTKTVAPIALIRLAMRDVTLIDGTVIPKGTLVAAAGSSIHRDQKNYNCADVFDPFRFSRAREDTVINATQAYAHTSSKWLAFGYGKHACPGRFYAVDQLKALWAYIVTHYDIKAHTAGRDGKIMVRKRQRDSLVRSRA